MKNWIHRAGIGISGIVILALCLTVASPKAVQAVVSAFVTVTNTSSNPVATGMSTNVGVPVQNLVTLQCGVLIGTVENQCLSSAVIDTRINPDGSLPTFVIPEGQTFVITDVNWDVPNCTPSMYCPVILFVPGILGGASTPNISLTALSTGSVADGSGRAIGSDHLTTGIPIRALPKIQAGSSSVVTITGYLTQ